MQTGICPEQPMKPAKWIPWWYSSISAGFALLAIQHMFTRDKAVLITVRLIIAAGFGVLAYMEFTSKKKG